MGLCEKHDEMDNCEWCGKGCVGCVLEPYQNRIDELKRCLSELADYTLCEAAGHPLNKAVRRAAHDMAGWEMPKRREK